MAYKHKEAFCMMRYAGNNKTGNIDLRIWNSRDGVTPFCMFSREYGVELQHVNWQHDILMPEYKPVKGDLIWRDITKEEAENAGKIMFDELASLYTEVKVLSDEELNLKYKYDIKTHLKSLLHHPLEYFVKLKVTELYDNHSPKLELIL